MKNLYLKNLLPVFLVLLVLLPSLSESADRLSVYTVNYPLQYFAERIGGDRIDVHFPAPGDVDPAFWMPHAETIGAYQKAGLIILNGANYARWVSKVSLPRLRTVDTSAGFSDRLITEKKDVTHNHGPGGEHAHSGTAFTTWLDFSQAIQQAEAILVALQRKQPDDSTFFAENFTKLERDLKALDTGMLSLAENAANRKFIASHPVYQYLARRYRLELTAVTWEPDAFPGQEQWQFFSRMLEHLPARLMLWEEKPMEKMTQKLSEMGVSIRVFSPCMNIPDEGDFLAVMQQNVENLKSPH
jgi:zinc transport system substrate-binding protein